MLDKDEKEGLGTEGEEEWEEPFLKIFLYI